MCFLFLFDFFYNDISVYLNLVHGPDWFNISKMPDNLKNVIRQRLSDLKQNSWITTDAASQIDGIINFMNTNTFDNKTWEDFFYKLGLHDNYRKENYYETFPEMGELIKAK